MDTLDTAIPKTKAAKEAVSLVLQFLYEQWDLGEGRLDRTVAPAQLQKWFVSTGLTTSQMEPVLKRFMASGLITFFEFLEGMSEEDYSLVTGLDFEFHPSFPEKYSLYKKRLSHSSESDMELQTKYGLLKLNKLTGDFALNNASGTLNPSSKEFKVLYTLMTAPAHSATYKELVGGEVTKESKRFLSFTIRRLRGHLGILPRKAATNEDIFGNLKRHGFRLTV